MQDSLVGTVSVQLPQLNVNLFKGRSSDRDLRLDRQGWMAVSFTKMQARMVAELMSAST